VISPAFTVPGPQHSTRGNRAALCFRRPRMASRSGARRVFSPLFFSCESSSRIVFRNCGRSSPFLPLLALRCDRPASFVEDGEMDGFFVLMFWGAIRPKFSFSCVRFLETRFHPRVFIKCFGSRPPPFWLLSLPRVALRKGRVFVTASGGGGFKTE